MRDLRKNSLKTMHQIHNKSLFSFYCFDRERVKEYKIRTVISISSAAMLTKNQQIRILRKIYNNNLLKKISNVWIALNLRQGLLFQNSLLRHRCKNTLMIKCKLSL